MDTDVVGGGGVTSRCLHVPAPGSETHQLRGGRHFRSNSQSNMFQLLITIYLISHLLQVIFIQYKSTIATTACGWMKMTIQD